MKKLRRYWCRGGTMSVMVEAIDRDVARAYAALLFKGYRRHVALDLLHANTVPDDFRREWDGWTKRVRARRASKADEARWSRLLAQHEAGPAGVRRTA